LNTFAGEDGRTGEARTSSNRRRKRRLDVPA
jgi:hypothetical protein